MSFCAYAFGNFGSLSTGWAQNTKSLPKKFLSPGNRL
jgi:hypothetical protein